jgi:hypothetical protein
VEWCGTESHEEEDGRCDFALNTERIRVVAVGAHEAARIPRRGQNRGRRGRNRGQQWSRGHDGAVEHGHVSVGDFPWWALGQMASGRFDVGLGRTAKGVGPFNHFPKFQSVSNIQTLSNL